MQLPICEICGQAIYGEPIKDQDGAIICKECDDKQDCKMSPDCLCDNCQEQAGEIMDR
jgi:hypothetical protein